MKHNNEFPSHNHLLSVSYQIIMCLGLGYMLLPICIFFFTWLHWYIGIPAIAILLYGFYRLMRHEYGADKEYITIPKVHFIIIAVLLLLWVWMSGIGNFFVSAYDHPWRIALFRDIVNFKWPVIYPDTGNALSYYLFYWLIPALFGKLLGWTIGNIALLVWTYFGVLLVFILLIHYCKTKTVAQIWSVAIVLFGWSGLNTIGRAITQILNINLYSFALDNGLGWLDLLFNGYSFNFFYRSNQETLVQIYNQATPLWIATILALKNRKKVQNFAFIGLCLLPFAPLPFVGLLVFFIVFFTNLFIQSYKDKKVQQLIKKTLSIQNLCAIITIIPIVSAFFSSNITTHQTDGGGLLLLPLELFDGLRITGLVLFWILQFGIIAILIFSEYKKDFLYYTVLVSLIFIPLFEFGKRGGRDFCMNASLPALFILMILTIQYVNKYVVQKELNLKNILILTVLIMAMQSPIQDIASKLDVIGDLHEFPVVNDSIYTYRDKQIGDIPWLENFLVPEPENTVFYKYLSR